MLRETVNPGQTFTETGQLLNGECGTEYNYTAIRAGVMFPRRARFVSLMAFYACLARWNSNHAQTWRYAMD